MSRLRIRGHGPLQAHLRVQGSKNGSLPCLAATLLHPGITVLDGVPMIQDVVTALKIMRALGAEIKVEGNRVVVHAAQIKNTRIPAHFMKQMRSSVIFMGALLARCGEAEAVYPGGCVLGSRPIDFHLDGFQKLGSQIKLQDECICVQAKQLTGTRITLPLPSVGATENLMLAATGAQGITIIENAAREPEILELAAFLRQMGFDICGEGTSCIRIHGKQKTKDMEFTLAGDRIAAGTWLFCCMNTGGMIELEHVPVDWMQSTLQVLRRMGAAITVESERLICRAPDRIFPVSYLETAPHPGFPTDLQSPLLAVLCRACGNSRIRENIFSSRFRTADELGKMGACITIDQDQKQAWIQGRCHFHGAEVTAPDLRGGAALVIAAMGADGETIIDDFYHVQRGYESITDTIRILGGETCWIGSKNEKQDG